MEGSDITVTVNLGCEGAGAKDDFIAKYGAETKIIVLLAKTDDGAYQLSKVSGDTMTRPSRSVGRRSVVCDDHPSRPTRLISPFHLLSRF